jgi:superfamily I DNA/RNA helicase
LVINPSPLRSFVKHSEEDIIKLTDEQYSCLEDIELNDRIVVFGGAGTGKTLIAVKDALQSSLVGEKVGVFCFNSNLAKHIRNNISDKSIDVYSFHAYLKKICGDIVDISDYEENEFFEEVLPKTAVEVLSNKEDKYTKLVIDEFQDLCKKKYLNVMDKMLQGGLFDGKFSFYGDFAWQAIYSDDCSVDLLKNYTYFANKKLTVNCRNTKNIGNEMVNISGFVDKSYKLKIDGEPVSYYSWSTVEEEKDLLIKCIKQLHKDGFDSDRIMILSPKSRANSVIGYSDKNKMAFGDYPEKPDSFQAMFSTVQAFKGLESEVVILTDIEDYSDQKLMYVGLSRARSKMFVLESAAASKQRKKIMSSF